MHIANTHMVPTCACGYHETVGLRGVLELKTPSGPVQARTFRGLRWTSNTDGHESRHRVQCSSNILVSILSVTQRVNDSKLSTSLNSRRMPSSIISESPLIPSYGFQLPALYLLSTPSSTLNIFLLSLAVTACTRAEE